MPRPPRRPDPPALETNDVLVVGIGTAVWAVLFLALLPFRDRLADDGHEWWLWTCLVGVGLGLVGTAFCRRRRAARGHGALSDPGLVAREPLP